ncbi:terminal uridylyltransferase 7-like [Polypterus senegalus]|uniref:terminal uridylyltransferase 7-like n=1 Tax=Polypterus senegalus TaxID=55291 RepID=UPI001966908B|nr:terminal uridylyltransferase 7-like [Polypterus senegalus]
MEDSGKHKSQFSKHCKERGNAADEAESWRSPAHQDFCGEWVHKADKSSNWKSSQNNEGTSPRKGGHSHGWSPSGFKKLSHNPRMRPHNDIREGFRKFPTPEDHYKREGNWRGTSNFKEYERERKDSIQGTNEADKYPDGNSRGKRNVKRQLHRDLVNEGESSENSGKKNKSKQWKRHNVDRDDDGIDIPVIDESALSEKELLGLHQAEERLGKDKIFRLKRHPRNCPNAKYSCTLCEVLIDSISLAHRHIKEKWHKKKIKEKREEELLSSLPFPDASQIKCIGDAIKKVVDEHGLSHEDVKKRQEIVASMEKTIKCLLPDCSLRVNGSSCSTFGFKDSDINIDIQFPAHMHQPDVLLLVQESLSKSTSFIDLETDFHARVPVVVCKEKESNLLCKVSAGNENAYLTSEHLAALAKLEPCTTPLVVAFRYWAKICHIDYPEEGGLPPYVFALMVIYFLQQRKEPVLPVYLGLWIEGFTMNKLNHFKLSGTDSSNVLWEYSPAVEDNTSCSDEFIRRGKASLTFATGHKCDVPIGQLWVELLRFYSLEFNMADYVISIRIKELLSRESKDWPKKRIAIEDPYSVKRNVARTLNSQLMYEYIIHCFKTTYKYFALPQKKQTKPNIRDASDLDQVGNITLTSTSAKSKRIIEEDLNVALPQINLGKLKLDSNSKTELIGRNQTVVHRLTQQEECDYLIEAQFPFDNPEVNTVHEDSDCVIEEVMEKMDDYKHSSCDTESGNESESLSDCEDHLNIGTEDGDDFALDDAGQLNNVEDTGSNDEAEDFPEEFVQEKQRCTSGSNNSEDYDEDEDEIAYQRLHLDSTNMEEEENVYTASGDEILSEDEHEQVTLDVLNANQQWGELVRQHQKGPSETDVVPIITNNVSNQNDMDNTLENGPFSAKTAHIDDLFYVFNRFEFTKGKTPTVVCGLCKREGHLKRDCPEDFKKVDLDPLPKMTAKFQRILNQVCFQCYKDFAPDQIEDLAREHILQNLEQFVKKEFEAAKLSLFGSSLNGFGFKQSDLDICMTFKGADTSKGLDCIKIIENLSKLLRSHSGLKNILPITTAKVPIVKFVHVRTGLEGDISLYNTLALHNTRLLATYSTIDERVKYLCYTMKVFAKICDIGDASRGSLSSYAYTLMVLYFLQQRKPPVIPVLQEIFDGKKPPQVLVDGWNVYFYDNLADLKNVWPEYGKNTESVGELWLGLLRFYTEEFDFKEHVICIRRKKLLTTFKKQWTSKYIVIEDPFDLNHNLGAGLSRKMTNFIMKAFINGRRVFGTPLKTFPNEYPSKMEYFFDPDVLTEGEEAPSDRCCRICGKIGHFMKDCPSRRKSRRRQDHKTHEDSKYQRRVCDAKELHNVESHSPRTRHEKQNYEAGRERIPRQSENRKKLEDREFREKRCFICGSDGHIKKECPQYKGFAGSSKVDDAPYSTSPSASKNFKNFKALESSPVLEEKKKQRQNIFPSPQKGSPAGKQMTQGRSSHGWNQQE